MSEIAADLTARACPAPAWRADLAAAMGVTLAAVALAAAGGFAILADANGDNDSLLRLVEVRDLIAGQGWFDLTQYRMGPAGGFVMHWSRLVDAPIAALVLAFGETAAAIVWPSLLYCFSLFLLVAAARRANGDEAAFPALAAGGLGLMSIGIFQPAALDHHNLQVTLALGMAAALLAGSRHAGFAAGVSAALMLAVGAEAVPYVAAGGLIAAGLFLFRGDNETPLASGFGLGFAATATAAFVATVAPRDWLAPACDAFSVAQFAVAVAAGLGLALIASVPAAMETFGSRLISLGLLGAGLAAFVVLAFPHCLADPYAGLDPRLKQFWLDQVVEAQSIFGIARHAPAMLATWYATPLLGLAVLIHRAVKAGWRRQDAIVGGLLAAAILVSLWQVRGALFSVPLAIIPLSGWIARARARAARDKDRGALFGMALAWLLSINAVWSGAANALAATAGASSVTEGGGTSASRCYAAADYAALAGLPPTTVLAISNLGSAILKHTPQRVLAGPYHRNVAGNLAALDMLLASPEAAEALARAASVRIVALCPGNGESGLLAQAAPGGLMAGLLAGEIPSWLEPVAGTGQSLRLYRVVARP